MAGRRKASGKFENKIAISGFGGQPPDLKPIRPLGKGAFGVVYSAYSSVYGLVAVKKVFLDPRYKNRELDMLSMIKHKNCVGLLTSFQSVGKDSNEVCLNIVMTYLPQSLHELVKSYRQDRKYMPIVYSKLFAFEMLAGLAYLHGTLGMTHRDLKPENILIDQDTGELKICDFGSAKMLKTNEASVAYIASRYYRAPELTLECENYTSAIDIWAAGCVIGEMLTAGMPLFPGRDSSAQVMEISKMLGPPTSEDLRSFQHMNHLPDFPQQVTSLEEKLPRHSHAAFLSLLKSMLVYNPSKRPTAKELLNHPCFDDLFTGDMVLPNGKRFPALER
jgi:glycogen synthase kinase 3 beta